LEGPVLQQGELPMVCVGLSEKDLKNFGGAVGTPLAPPLFTSKTTKQDQASFFSKLFKQANHIAC